MSPSLVKGELHKVLRVDLELFERRGLLLRSPPPRAFGRRQGQRIRAYCSDFTGGRDRRRIRRGFLRLRRLLQELIVAGLQLLFVGL